MKRQWFHLTIRASPASIWCMSGYTANGSETRFMTIDDIRAQYVCLNTDIVFISEECICVWAMVNDKNYYFAINKHINCVRHWHIIQYAILNNKLFLCLNDFPCQNKWRYLQYPFVLVSVRTQRGWSDYIFPFSTIRFAGIVNISDWNFFHEQTNHFLEVLVKRIHGFSSILKHYPAAKGRISIQILIIFPKGTTNIKVPLI